MGLPAEAIEKIKEMIISGRLSPGDRLPREQDLAAELGMSKNMLREAVTALSLINVLDVRRGDGTYVTDLSPQLLLDALTFVADFQRDDTVLNFIEVREMLEPTATAIAARKIDTVEIDSLYKHLETMREDIDVDELVTKDAEFHRRIITAAGNPILTSVLETLSRPLHRARVWRDYSSVMLSTSPVSSIWPFSTRCAAATPRMLARGRRFTSPVPSSGCGSTSRRTPTTNGSGRTAAETSPEP